MDVTRDSQQVAPNGVVTVVGSVSYTLAPSINAAAVTVPTLLHNHVTCNVEYDPTKLSFTGPGNSPCDVIRDSVTNNIELQCTSIEIDGVTGQFNWSFSMTNQDPLDVLDDVVIDITCGLQGCGINYSSQSLTLTLRSVCSSETGSQKRDPEQETEHMPLLKQFKNEIRAFKP